MLDAELAAQLALIRRSRELVPFLSRILSVGEVCWRVLPEEMLTMLRSSPDFVPPPPGAPSLTVQISAGDEAAELVLYRADAAVLQSPVGSAH